MATVKKKAAPKKKVAVKKKAAPKKKVAKKNYDKKPNGKNATGVPDFKPTKQHREMVSVLSAAGFTQEQICRLIPSSKDSDHGIDLKTLRKYFRDDLDTGKDRANARIAATMYRMAASGSNTAATIFYCRTQLKYNTRVELTDPNGDAVGTGFGNFLKEALIKEGKLVDDSDDTTDSN